MRMQNMRFLTIAGVMLVTSWSRADLVITLQARNTALDPITPGVLPGTQAMVDVLLSVDGADNPLSDLRSLAFDARATSPTIVPVQFNWLLSPTVYSFQMESLPTPMAASLLVTSNPGHLDLTAAPVLVASLTVTINGDGTLDLVTGAAGSSETVFSADFVTPRDFAPATGNVRGGTLAFTVALPTGPPPEPPPGPLPAPDPQAPSTVDTDGDGVADDFDADDDGDGVDDILDAFPLDPTETADTDGDGVGDNRDAFPTDPAETMDTDHDGIGDNADPDDDGDGVNDAHDAAPLDPDVQSLTPDNSGSNGATPRAGGICGLGMLAALGMILAGLTGLRLAPILVRRTSGRS